MVRTGLVAVLLCLAAAALYAEPPPPAPTPTAGPSPPTTAAPVLPHGFVGVPIRLAEPAVLAAVRAGDRVDVLMLPGGVPVATAVLVLAGAGDVEAPVLLVALTETQAHTVVVAGPDARYGVVVRTR